MEFIVNKQRNMMKRNTRLAIWGLSGIAVTTALLIPAIGADRGDSTGKGTGTAVRGAGDKGERGRGPGSLWQKAAELQKTLSAEEKARLLSRADAPYGGGPGDRPDGPPREGMRGMGPKGMGPKGMGPLEKILTAEQKTRVEAIQSTYKAKFEALASSRGNGTITEEQFREQARPLHEAMKREIDAVLTAGQKAQLDTMRTEGRGGRGHGGPGGEKGMGDKPFGPRTPADAAAHETAEREAMATALGLSDAQKSSVEKLFAAHRTEAGALMEKLKADGVDREAARTQMQALREKHMAALAAVLNATQMEIVKIHDAIGHHRGGHGHRHGGPDDRGANPGTTSPGNPTRPGGATIE